MARKNFGVRLGRPPATAASKLGAPPKAPLGGAMPAPLGAAPMDGFAPGLPAAGFKKGGASGFATMPHHHDDPGYCKGGKVR
jgi:hypothetical protein